MGIYILTFIIQLLLFLSVFLVIKHYNNYNETKELNRDIDEISKGIREKYKEEKLLIIAGNEYLNVPCKDSGKEAQGIFEIIANRLNDSAIVRNICSIRINKSWYVKWFLKYNLTMEDIKNMQCLGIEYSQKNSLPERIAIRSSYKKPYKVLGDDKEFEISTQLKSSKTPIFILSTGLNDFMHVLHSNPFDIRYNKKIIEQAIKKIDDEIVISKIISDVEKTFAAIYNVNSSTQIYCLSLYYPEYIKKSSKVFKHLTKVIKCIEQYNQKLKELCDKNGVVYIDITFLSKSLKFPDIRLGYQGSLKLVKEILNNIYEYQPLNTKKKFYMDPNYVQSIGVEGVIQEIQNNIDRLEVEILELDSSSSRFEECSTKIAEYHKEKELFCRVLNKSDL